MRETVLKNSNTSTDSRERSRTFPLQEIIRLIYRLADSRTDPEMRSRLLKAAGCPEDILTMRPYELSCYLKAHSRAASLFLMVLELSACRICDYYTLPQKLSSYRETARLFMRHYLCRPYEQFTAAACDKRLRIADEIYVSEKGSTLKSSVPINEIIRYSINSGASYLILAHNHPVSKPEPSQEDVLATMHISKILGELDIVLADHIIISGTNAYSMRLSGNYTEIFGTGRFYKSGDGHICSFNHTERSS